MGSLNSTYGSGRLATTMTPGDDSGSLSPYGINAGMLADAMSKMFNLSERAGEEGLSSAMERRKWAEDDRLRRQQPNSGLSAAAPTSTMPPQQMSPERRLYMNKQDLDYQMNPLQNYTGTKGPQNGMNFFNLPAAQAMSTGSQFPNGFDIYAELLKSAGGSRPQIGLPEAPWGQGT